MSNEDLSAVGDTAASHDELAAPSTAPEAKVDPQGQTEAGATETTDEPKKVNKVQQRINQLTREKYEQSQENATLKARLDKLEQVAPVAKTIERVAPNEDDFGTLQEYHTANAKYYADVSSDAAQEKVLASDNANKQATAETQRSEQLEAKKKGFEGKLESIRGNFEDFEDVAYGHKFIDLDLAEQIFDLDKGPEVAYHLGSNLDEAQRIFSLTPVQRARELTKLEFQVEALKPNKVSGAPDAITPLGSSEKVDLAGKDGENLSTDDWQAWRNKQKHG